MRIEVPASLESESFYREEPSGRTSMRAKVLAPAPLYVDAFGERRTVHAWALETGVGPSVLRRRLERYPAEVALSLAHYSHADPHAPPGAPGAWTWEALAYEDDPWAQAFVARHPAGATLDQVGAALGLVRERVRQVEETAMRKFETAARALGLSLSELVSAWTANGGRDAF